MAGTDLRLTVLGSASPYPDPHNFCSGYLVTCGDSRIWVDAGTGTLAALRRHTSLDRLTAIWISHRHADCEHGMPAFAARFATDEVALVYSGDTAPCPALTELARDCDLLLCEADSNTAPTDEPSVHHTPEQAGATAAAANARRLLVTHIGPWLAPEDAITRAAAEFSGRIDYASPGRTFPA